MLSIFLQEISVKGKSTTKPRASKEAIDDTGTSYEVVKKDLNALSKEEQMDVVYRYNWAAQSLFMLLLWRNFLIRKEIGREWC